MRVRPTGLLANSCKLAWHEGVSSELDSEGGVPVRWRRHEKSGGDGSMRLFHPPWCWWQHQPPASTIAPRRGHAHDAAWLSAQAGCRRPSHRPRLGSASRAGKHGAIGSPCSPNHIRIADMSSGSKQSPTEAQDGEQDDASQPTEGAPPHDELIRMSVPRDIIGECLEQAALYSAATNCSVLVPRSSSADEAFTDLGVTWTVALHAQFEEAVALCGGAFAGEMPSAPRLLLAAAALRSRCLAPSCAQPNCLTLPMQPSPAKYETP